MMSSEVQGFTDGSSRVQRQKSQKRMVHAEIPAPGHPRAESVHKAMWAEETSDSVCYNDTPEALRQRPAAGNGSQDDRSRAHVCVSCLTAQLVLMDRTYPRLSGQTGHKSQEWAALRLPLVILGESVQSFKTNDDVSCELFSIDGFPSF